MATSSSSDASKVSNKKKFGYFTKAIGVVEGMDFKGKVVIITGANAGIGYDCTRALSHHGFKVIMACRDLQRANNSLKQLKEEKPDIDVEVMQCDLQSLKSTKKFADEFLQKNLDLNLLICNAGVMHIPFELTEDNFEKTFQVNYLAHVYLIQLLEQKLISSAPSRLVLVSSDAHYAGTIKKSNLSVDFLNPTKSSSYWKWTAYCNSKQCMNLIAHHLAKKYKPNNVSVFACHPGLVQTELQRYSILARVGFLLSWPFSKSSEQGASTPIYCAVMPGLEEHTGKYFSSCALKRPSSSTLDDELAENLWNITQEMLEKATKF